jgi:hypothetical protein
VRAQQPASTHQVPESTEGIFMAANKYPSRKTSTSKRKARAVPQRGVPLSDLEVRLKAPPHAGGPIRDVRPSAKVLQGLIPPANIVSVKSGLVARTDSAQPYLGPGVAGFAWDVPAPDPSLGTCVWATISFDWAFYGGQSDTPKNFGDQTMRIYGSVDWYWYLTGHPQIFPAAPIFLTDGGQYSFYMDVAPGDGGFDVGWLTPPRAGSYSNKPDKTDASMTSPLQRLLSTDVNGVLKLWFAVDFRNQTPLTATIGNPWGPNTLYWSYAYASPFGTMASG